MAHFGGVLYILPSLLIYLILKDRGPKVRVEAKEALNWQITFLIIFIVWEIIGAILTITLFSDLNPSASDACADAPAELRDACESAAGDIDLDVPGRIYFYLVLLLVGSLAAIGGGVLIYLKKNFAHYVIVGGGALLLLGSILLFGLLMEYIGLVPASIILILLAAYARQSVKLGETIVFAVAMAVACGLLFVRGLGQSLPLWWGTGLGDLASDIAELFHKLV